jgi:hypothetical protein
MKLTFFIVPGLLATVGIALSQNADLVETIDTSNSPTVARIIGEIPDGTIPTPEPPKPGFVIADRNVLSKKIYQDSGRTITFQRIAPIVLPPPPDPPAASEHIQDVLLERQPDADGEEASAGGFVMAGATVFRPKDSPPLSLVQVWPQGSGQAVVFWSSADFGLLSGISSFIGSDGKTRSLMLMWSASEPASLVDLKTELGPQNPQIPDFSDGKATFSITSDRQAPAATLLTIQSLHDIYNSDYKRLKTAYEGREQARLEREAELKANPPRPQNITLNFWRTEKSATDANGGAQ